MVPRSEPHQFLFVGAFDGKCLLGSPIGPEDTIARLHAAMGMVNSGMLQNVRESIIQRANKCVEVGGGLFEHLL
jgi:hypothetical protein